MKIDIIHPHSVDFPAPVIDWKERNLYPIGSVRIGRAILPLALTPDRKPVAIQDDVVKPLDIADVGPAFYDALEAVGDRLWGHGWHIALGDLFGVNRRTTQRDRIARFLLPPPVIMMIAYIGSADDGPMLARGLQLLQRLRRDKGPEYAATMWQFIADLAPKIDIGHVSEMLGVFSSYVEFNGGNIGMAVQYWKSLERIDDDEDITLGIKP